MAEIFSDSVTHICKFTNSKSSASLKQDNFAGNHVQTHHSQTAANQDRKPQRQSGETTQYIQGKDSNDQSSPQKPWKTLEQHLQVMKGKIPSTWILYPTKISFNSEDEIKAFSYKVKQRGLITTRLELQEMLRDFLQAEEK